MNSLNAVINVVIVGLIGGMAVGLQGPLSGAISQRVGPMGSSLIIHVGGALITAAVILFVGGVNWQGFKGMPAPYFLAGLFGVILYLTFSYTLPRAGVGVTTALLILAQMGMGLLIDHNGWMGVPVNPINASRVLGAGAILLGAFLVTK
ncbi:MAG: DMT family transporter [Anaerolineales bacterium]|nr:DMT family transporter [Anaerolineales bacterium]